MTETFSGFLQQRREALGISVARFAELVGRSPSTVRSWERGRSRPGDPTTVAAISAVLDVDEEILTALIAGEDVDVPGLAPEPPEVPWSAPPPPVLSEPERTFFVATAVSPLEEERVRRVPFLPTPPRRRVLERADRGLRYQARAIGTLVAIIVLVVVLKWALGGFGGALTDLKDSVFGP